jgi:hypothetical protein
MTPATFTIAVFILNNLQAVLLSLEWRAFVSPPFNTPHPAPAHNITLPCVNWGAYTWPIPRQLLVRSCFSLFPPQLIDMEAVWEKSTSAA